ncbi:MAG: arylsulfatase [Candidatus Lokiarchaeota archaeon]|nr:arylsulfatase [Candidatus Lokiarchaeota archaeon]
MATAPASPGKPHIVLIMADQMRGDCIGCAGNRAIITPNIDALGADGVVFTRAYTSIPSCTPARAVLLTGLSPWKNGMLGYGRMAPRYKHEMPRLLRDAGYRTVAVGKMHYHPQRSPRGFEVMLLDESSRRETPGFTSDYHQWFERQAPGKDPNATFRHGVGWNENKWADYALDENLHPTCWTGQQAVAQIMEHDTSKPLFLKVSFARPHSPYDAPSRFVEMYDWKDMPAPWIGEWSGKFKDWRKTRSPAFGDFGEEFAKRARRHYYANVTFIDEQVGRIIDALRNRGMYGESLVMFFADHGDMLGDHHHWRKTYAYEGSASIPMVLRWPAAMRAAVTRGSSISRVVELRDVLPTFLDAAGVPTPVDLDGKSLISLVRGEGTGWREYVDLEHFTCYDRHNCWVGLTDGRQKYVYFRPSGEEQLFDLERDPGELHDLARDPAHGQALQAWRARLVAHLAPRGKDWVKKGKLVRTRKGSLYSPNHPSE